jgi:hypothetical protein
VGQTPSCESSWASRSNAMMSSNSTLESVSCRTAPVGGDRLPAACSAVPVAPGFRPCSRHRLDHAPQARICAQPYGASRAASGGKPPEALPDCYRDAASQSLCHSSRWSHTLLVSHHRKSGETRIGAKARETEIMADFESELLFAHLPNHKSSH